MTSIPTDVLFFIGGLISLGSGTALATTGGTRLYRWSGVGHLAIAALSFAAAYFVPPL